MGATGDFQRSLDLQACFAGMSRDGLGATRAAMQATKEATADSFKSERDPAGKKWNPLAPSTLKRRAPGPILGGLVPDLIWGILANGVWYLRSQQKGYAVYHLGPDIKRQRPARPFLPVTEDAQRAVAARVGDALAMWQEYHRRRVGL